MKAIYSITPDCMSCYDLLGADCLSICNECLKNLKEEVEVLNIGVGIFGNKAVIKKSDGTVNTVPIKSLTFKEENNENS